MAWSKKHLNDPAIREKVRQLYCETLMTAEQVAEAAGVNPHTAYQILKVVVPPELRSKFKGLKYAASKKGANSPFYGKRGAEMPNFVGDCADGRGYLTRVVNGKRHFVHQIVAAEMLGIPVEQFPESLLAHHIDENRQNNDPDNLAITTNAGHAKIHKRYKHTLQESKLRGLSLVEAVRYLTSR